MPFFKPYTTTNASVQNTKNQNCVSSTLSWLFGMEPQSNFLKFLLIGDTGSGKSSLLVR